MIDGNSTATTDFIIITNIIAIIIKYGQICVSDVMCDRPQ